MFKVVIIHNSAVYTNSVRHRWHDGKIILITEFHGE